MRHNLVSHGMAFGLGLLVLQFLLSWLHPQSIHDEKYHEDMADAYLHWNFKYWNPMVTTPPGLYVASLLLQLPFFLGFLFKRNLLRPFPLSFLRMTSVVFSWLFMYFLSFSHLNRMIEAADFNYYKLRDFSESKAKKFKQEKTRLEKCIGPPPLLLLTNPLFLTYSLLYYTDISSLFMIFLGHINADSMFWFGINSLISLLFRQSNIIWIIYNGLCAKEQAKVWPGIFLSLAVTISFFIWNGGQVVLGDHEHHLFRIHWEQMFYLGSFAAFAFPFIIPWSFLTAKKTETVAEFCLFSFIAWMMEQSNLATPIHPYNQMDSTHLTFWFMHLPRKLTCSLGYLTLKALFLSCRSLWGGEETVKLFLIIIPSVILSPLVEPRYFLPALLFLFLRLPKPDEQQIKRQLGYNLVTSCVCFGLLMMKGVLF